MVSADILHFYIALWLLWCRVEFENEWSQSSNSPTWLHGVDRDNFTFYFLLYINAYQVSYPHKIYLTCTSLGLFLNMNAFLKHMCGIPEVYQR